MWKTQLFGQVSGEDKKQLNFHLIFHCFIMRVAWCRREISKILAPPRLFQILLRIPSFQSYPLVSKSLHFKENITGVWATS